MLLCVQAPLHLPPNCTFAEYLQLSIAQDEVSEIPLDIFNMGSMAAEGGKGKSKRKNGKQGSEVQHCSGNHNHSHRFKGMLPRVGNPLSRAHMSATVAKHCPRWIMDQQMP